MYKLAPRPLIRNTIKSHWKLVAVDSVSNGKSIETNIITIKEGNAFYAFYVQTYIRVSERGNGGVCVRRVRKRRRVGASEAERREKEKVTKGCSGRFSPRSPLLNKIDCNGFLVFSFYMRFRIFDHSYFFFF